MLTCTVHVCMYVRMYAHYTPTPREDECVTADGIECALTFAMSALASLLATVIARSNSRGDMLPIGMKMATHIEEEDSTLRQLYSRTSL